MDYLEIVLQGYFDNNNRKHLEKYFYREYKKAEKENFEPDEFFDGCFSVVEQFEGYLKRLIHERKIELKTMLSLAKVGKLDYDNLKGKTIEQKWKETIEFCNDELKDVRPDWVGDETYHVSLSELTTHRNNGLGRIYYNMRYNEVLFIKDAIQAAKVKATAPKEIDELFEQLEKAGNIYLDVLKESFCEKYGSPNQRTVTDELNEINNFIAKAESFSTNETFKSTIDEYKHSDINRIDLEQMFEYSRLKHDYYKNKENFSPYFTIFFNVQTTWVYSKYFLYKKWLEDLNKQFAPDPTGKPQQDSSNTETLSDFITHENSVDIAERIKNQYKGIRGKDLKILFLALNELQLLPPGRIAAKFYRCCKNTFDWDIAVPQAVNDYKFKKGQTSNKGNYIQTDDEKELNQMKTFLNEVINGK